ncbi:PstS family phosphate ABC transporter substrate-binding protein [Thiocapsa rosea]|uniref:PstS family phosphate ABC transporter substrate-binding protein n=1 Tax=Thiocapsa rosea TaxID=69360 RepID=UPI0014760615|nr:substrate-binding domain-containing protein [Thiocapsa rosea]
MIRFTLVVDAIVRRIRESAAAAVLLAGVTALSCGPGMAHAEEIKIGGTGGALATMRILGEAYSAAHPGTEITVLPSLGSSGGIKAMLSGVIQIAVTSRALTDTEINAGAVQIAYARTPFVFATASTNTTTGLSLQELVEIYAGRSVHWPDGTRIRLVMRPTGDSDSDMIKSMSPAMDLALSGAETRKGMAFAVTDQDAADNLERIPGALGPSTLAQILSEKRALKALELDDVEPSPTTIADGSYPYFKTLFMVTRSDISPALRQFMAFVRSAAGVEILTRTGHRVQ